MSQLLRRTLLATFAAMVIAPLACLESIDEATACPGDDVYTYCAPPLFGPDDEAGRQGGPEAGGPGGPPAGLCIIKEEGCIKRQRDCACTEPSAGCKRTSSTCFPPPDCPPSVRAQTPGAQCLKPGVSARPGTGLGGPDAGPAMPCICGCAECAEACDGMGPVLGPEQAVNIGFTLGRSAGRFGIYVRARGAGKAVVALRVGANAPTTLGTFEPTNSFREFFPNGGGLYAWDGDGLAPTELDIRTEDDSFMEIDCIVPFVAP